MERGSLISLGFILALGFLSASCSYHALRPVPVEGGYLFQLKDPTAHEVALAGSFNDWSEFSSPLAEDSNGLWRIIVPLKKGPHTYMFVVTKKDGKKIWIEPPEAPCYIPDGFGGRNGLIHVMGE